VYSRTHAQFVFRAGDTDGQLRVGDQLVVNSFIADTARYETHLVITDVEGSGSLVDVMAYDDGGTLRFERSYVLPIFGKLNFDPSLELDSLPFVGSIRIQSDGGNVAAQYWRFYRDPERAPWNTALPAADAEGARALLCQHFVAAPGIDARLVLVNPNADSSVIVSVTFYLDRGKQLTRDKHVIPPNGAISLDPYVENEGLIRTGVAYVEVVSGGRITGEYWQASDAEQYQVSLPMEYIPVRGKYW
jgi:hypothetical protein